MQFLTIVMTCGEFEITDDHKAGKTTVNLTGRVDKCSRIIAHIQSVIFIMLATSADIIGHKEAK